MIVGDININLAGSLNNQVQNYCASFSSFGYRQLISVPTRIDTAATTIDHIYTNIDSSEITSGVIETSVTDHFSTFFILANSTLGRKNDFMSYTYDFKVLKQLVARENWDSIYEILDVNVAYKTFLDKLSVSVNNSKRVFNSKRQAYFNVFYNPWMMQAILD